MRLVILDPNLVDTHGHHALYNRLLAAEWAARRGETVILGNQTFPEATLGTTPVYPALKTTAYAQFSTDPVLGPCADVEQGNAAVYEEMSGLPADFFRPSDLVVAHTVSHITLGGLVDWIATLAPETAPQFCILLMLPSGVAVDGSGAPRELFDPIAAMAYRKAFRVVREKGLNVTFMASGHQHALQFSALSAEDIPSHALLTAFDADSIEADPDPSRVLLYAGDAKMNKGLGVLPDLITEICPRHPEMSFHIHANPGPAWGPALDVVEELRGLAPEFPNLDLKLGELDGPSYGRLLAASGIVLLPYDPEEYRHKSSGVVWEAIASQSHLVVPAGGWLEAECAHWGTAHTVYDAASPGALTTALGRAITDYAPDLAANATRKFTARNGIKALFDQLADIWVSHPASVTPLVSHLDARQLSGPGWYDVETVQGLAVRWTSGQADTNVTMPAIGTWRISLRGPSFRNVEQLLDARLEIDGVSQAITAEWDENGTWTLSIICTETELHQPERVLRLHVPAQQENAVGSGERELGLLVSSLSVTEVIFSALEPAPENEHLDEDGWTALLRYSRWRGALQQGRMLSFEISKDMDTADIENITLLINGRSKRLRVSSAATWRAQALLSNEDAGDITCEVILPKPAKIRMQGFGAAPGTHIVLSSPERASVSPKVTPATSTEDEMVEWDFVSTETMGTFSQCLLKVSHFQNNSRWLDVFFVKILKDESYVALELAEQDGAFQLLQKPDPSHVAQSEWGDKITIFASPDGVLQSPSLNLLAEDITGLRRLLTGLLEGVQRSGVPLEKRAAWETAAEALKKIV